MCAYVLTIHAYDLVLKMGMKEFCDMRGYYLFRSTIIKQIAKDRKKILEVLKDSKKLMFGFIDQTPGNDTGTTSGYSPNINPGCSNDDGSKVLKESEDPPATSNPLPHTTLHHKRRKNRRKGKRCTTQHRGKQSQHHVRFKLKGFHRKGLKNTSNLKCKPVHKRNTTHRVYNQDGTDGKYKNHRNNNDVREKLYHQETHSHFQCRTRGGKKSHYKGDDMYRHNRTGTITTHNRTLPQHHRTITTSKHHRNTIKSKYYRIGTTSKHNRIGTVPKHNRTGTVPTHNRTSTVPKHNRTDTVPKHNGTGTVPKHNRTGTVPTHNRTSTTPKNYTNSTVSEHHKSGTVSKHHREHTVPEQNNTYPSSHHNRTNNTIHNPPKKPNTLLYNPHYSKSYKHHRGRVISKSNTYDRKRKEQIIDATPQSSVINDKYKEFRNGHASLSHKHTSTLIGDSEDGDDESCAVISDGSDNEGKIILSSDSDSYKMCNESDSGDDDVISSDNERENEGNKIIGLQSEGDRELKTEIESDQIHEAEIEDDNDDDDRSEGRANRDFDIEYENDKILDGEGEDDTVLRGNSNNESDTDINSEKESGRILSRWNENDLVLKRDYYEGDSDRVLDENDDCWNELNKKCKTAHNNGEKEHVTSQWCDNDSDSSYSTVDSDEMEIFVGSSEDEATAQSSGVNHHQKPGDHDAESDNSEGYPIIISDSDSDSQQETMHNDNDSDNSTSFDLYERDRIKTRGNDSNSDRKPNKYSEFGDSSSDIISGDTSNSDKSYITESSSDETESCTESNEDSETMTGNNTEEIPIHNNHKDAGKSRKDNRRKQIPMSKEKLQWKPVPLPEPEGDLTSWEALNLVYGNLNTLIQSWDHHEYLVQVFRRAYKLECKRWREVVKRAHIQVTIHARQMERRRKARMRPGCFNYPTKTTSVKCEERKGDCGGSSQWVQNHVKWLVNYDVTLKLKHRAILHLMKYKEFERSRRQSYEEENI